MSPLRTLLRCLLILAFCLEGSLSLWASSAMAAGSVHGVDVTGNGMATAAFGDGANGRVAGNGVALDDVAIDGLAIDEDCDDPLVVHEHGSIQDCDCAQGSGCTCAFGFPVGAMTHVPLFAAQHLLASVPLVIPRPPARMIATARVFRPPIG